MAKCHYCGHEEQTVAQKTWSAAAAKWNEYQIKHGVGWVLFATFVTIIALLAVGISSLSTEPGVSKGVLFVITGVNVPLAILGFGGLLVALVGGVVWWGKRVKCAHAAFEKDHPDMAKLLY